MYYDHEFYHEPSEFEQQIYEFKESITNAIKDDFVKKMERLEKENAELQEVKKNFDQIKREYKTKIRQLESEREDMERKIRKERLNKLLEEFQTTLYRVDYEYEYPPKCDKCDDNRMVSYTTPLGKAEKEECLCKVSTKIYFPEEYRCIQLNLYGDGTELSGAYRGSGDNSVKEYVEASEIYQTGTSFAELPNSHYRTFFSTKDECQLYCDWLTEQERKKAEVS